MKPRLVSYEHSIVSTHPEVAREWHPTLNQTIFPEQVSKGSSFRAWWQCELGHEWQAKIYHRTNGKRCPFCFSNKVIPGVNDVLTTHPFVKSMVADTLNESIQLTELSKGSRKKFWWQCRKNHQWQATIKSITSGTRCPECCKYKVTSEHNLAKKFPELAKEWHPNKNGSQVPETFGISSQEVIWWQCEQGHEWQKTIYSRVRNPKCPQCLRVQPNSSLVEKQAISYLGKQLKIESTAIFRPLVSDRKLFRTIDGCFIINNLVFFVEYDGEYWHTEDKVVDRDLRKTKLILEASDNYYLIRLRENTLPHLPINNKRLLQQSITSKAFESSLDKVVEWIQNILQQQEITQYPEIEMTYQPVFRLAATNRESLDNMNTDALGEVYPQPLSFRELTHDTFVLALKKSLKEELANFDLKYADYLKYLDENEPHRKQEWIHDKQQSIAHRLNAIREGRMTMLTNSEE